jgi:hypothetical protein
MENKERSRDDGNTPPRQAKTLQIVSNLRAALCHLKASLRRTVGRRMDRRSYGPEKESKQVYKHYLSRLILKGKDLRRHWKKIG